MAGYILKLWHINTRGEPRLKFMKRVEMQIKRLADKKYIKIYMAKNERIKLGRIKFMRQGKLF